ncbi:MAG TPA: DUF4157 domain-containing protein [Thermoanaerobaculia bacterium]|nr:DUF4157 domain-containing protein [Thermoanaerobaculia bacterium]
MFSLHIHRRWSPAPSASRIAGELEARRAAAQIALGETASGLRSVPEETGLAPTHAQEVLASPGQPLDGSMRTELEPRFGHDFSRVRVHTDARAAESAGALHARAYTFGQDIVFGPGRYQPGSCAGRSLIGHELAHVVQQRRAGRPALQLDSDLESFPEDERTKIRVLVEPLSEKKREAVESAYPDGSEVELPHGMTIQLGSSVDESDEEGLKRVVGLLIEDSDGVALPAGTSITLAITAAGEVYRFTRVERPSIKLPGAKAPMPQVVVVEKTGAIGAIPTETSESTLEEKKVEVRKVKMTRGPGWKKSDWAALSAALEAIPEMVLKQAAGVRFLREAKKVCSKAALEARTCNPETDAETSSAFGKITFFDNALKKSTTRHGTATSLESVLVHEIGHLADNAALVKALLEYEKGAKGKKAKKKLLAARSLSGVGWVKDIDSSKEGLKLKFLDPGGAPAGSFREAAIQDGLSVEDDSKTIVSGGITAYGQTGWGELFAESYMMYFTDADLLKAIRPNVFAYFAAIYPKR